MLNIVGLVVKALKAAELNAYDILPQGASRPVARVEANGVFGPSSHMPDWLGEYDLQIDVWGETHQQAVDLKQSIDLVLRSHPSNSNGQITRYEPVGQSFEPDPTWPVGSVPGPRYVFLVRCWAHP